MLSNYEEIKVMYQKEKDPEKKRRLKESLDCMKYANRNRNKKRLKQSAMKKKVNKQRPNQKVKKFRKKKSEFVNGVHFSVRNIF